MLFHIKNHETIVLVGSAIGLSSLFFGWLTVKPNRLAAGISLSLWDSFDWTGAALIIILWIALMALSFSQKDRLRSTFSGIIANLILVITFILISLNSNRLLIDQSSLIRVSLSSGVWLTWIGVFVVIFGSRRGLRNIPAVQYIISWSGLAFSLILLSTGWLNNISVLQEYMVQKDRLLQELQTHIFLFGGSTIIGTILGIPLGIWAYQSQRAERPIFFFANIAETIPSLALFGILIAPLSALSQAFPILRQIGIHGIGTAPAMIALVVYSLLPIIQNTYSGLRQLDPVIIEAGLGMGMGRFRVLRRVEFPLAAPLIIEGIRTAAVQAVGNTAIAALIGAGGLGQLIFQGLGQAAPDLILLGSIPIIILALIIGAVMDLLIKISTPSGLMVKEK
jgi:osmoprotectant transport system permease protein